MTVALRNMHVRCFSKSKGTFANLVKLSFLCWLASTQLSYAFLTGGKMHVRRSLLCSPPFSTRKTSFVVSAKAEKKILTSEQAALTPPSLEESTEANDSDVLFREQSQTEMEESKIESEGSQVYLTDYDPKVFDDGDFIQVTDFTDIKNYSSSGLNKPKKVKSKENRELSVKDTMKSNETISSSLPLGSGKDGKDSLSDSSILPEILDALKVSALATSTADLEEKSLRAEKSTKKGKLKSPDSSEIFLLEESSSGSSEEKQMDNKYDFTDAISGLGNLVEFESEIDVPQQLELSDVLIHASDGVVDVTAAVSAEIRVQKQEEVELQHLSEPDKDTTMVENVLPQYSSTGRSGVTVVVTPQDLLDFATLNLLLVEGISDDKEVLTRPPVIPEIERISASVAVEVAENFKKKGGKTEVNKLLAGDVEGQVDSVPQVKSNDIENVKGSGESISEISSSPTKATKKKSDTKESNVETATSNIFDFDVVENLTLGIDETNLNVDTDKDSTVEIEGKLLVNDLNGGELKNEMEQESINSVNNIVDSIVDSRIIDEEEFEKMKIFGVELWDTSSIESWDPLEINIFGDLKRSQDSQINLNSNLKNFPTDLNSGFSSGSETFLYGEGSTEYFDPMEVYVRSRYGDSIQSVIDNNEIEGEMGEKLVENEEDISSEKENKKASKQRKDEKHNSNIVDYKSDEKISVPWSKEKEKGKEKEKKSDKKRGEIFNLNREVDLITDDGDENENKNENLIMTGISSDSIILSQDRNDRVLNILLELEEKINSLEDELQDEKHRSTQLIQAFLKMEVEQDLLRAEFTLYKSVSEKDQRGRDQ